MLVLGLFVGVTAGYVGGRTESLLMRFVDFIYGIPFIPFAIVLITFFGAGFYTTIAIIGLVLWRFIARVIRSQVLQIKQRPYIMAAKASGASAPWIIRKHILPNIANMAALFFAMGVGLAILEQAGLSFIGVTDPFTPTWGIMIRNAHQSGRVADAWWWSYPPGIMIALTVLSLYLLGRGYEDPAERTRWLSNMSDPILEFDRVDIEYETRGGTAVHAVNDASFAIDEHDYFGLVGESGCGKSTIADAVVGGLDENGAVTSGEIRYKGTPIQDYSEKEFNKTSAGTRSRSSRSHR